MATGAPDPELRCCVSAWAVAQIAAFQHAAHKFAGERQLKFAVVCTDLRCAESRAAQAFLAQHAQHRGSPTNPNPSEASPAGNPAVPSTAQVAWLIWRPSNQQRCCLHPGPDAGVALERALVAEHSTRPPGWTAAVHVLDTTRQECAMSADNALEAVLSGSGDWQAAESPFSV